MRLHQQGSSPSARATAQLYETLLLGAHYRPGMTLTARNLHGFGVVSVTDGYVRNVYNSFVEACIALSL